MRRRERYFACAGVLLCGTALFAMPAAADDAKCTALSTLSLADVTAIAATPVAAGTFVVPPPFPGLPPGPPVPVAFCRVQITVAPQIHIEVWLPAPDKWNHRYQAEGGAAMPA